MIVVTLLPIFFSSVAGFMRNTTSAMSIWGYVTSIAMLISALLAPVIGALGDFKGMRKKMFFVFLAVGVLACAGLAVTPMTGFAENTGVAEAVGTAILILYVISQIGFSGANLYYDSFYPTSPPKSVWTASPPWATAWAISAAPPSRCSFFL